MKTLRTAPSPCSAWSSPWPSSGPPAPPPTPSPSRSASGSCRARLPGRSSSSFVDAYSQATSEAAGRRSSCRAPPTAPGRRQFTAQFLNDQLSLQLAELAVDRARPRGHPGRPRRARSHARAELRHRRAASPSSACSPRATSSSSSRASPPRACCRPTWSRTAPPTRRSARIYDASGDTYAEPQVCVSHILILAGQPDGTDHPERRRLRHGAHRDRRGRGPARRRRRLRRRRHGQLRGHRQRHQRRRPRLRRRRAPTSPSSTTPPGAQPVGEVGQPVKTDVRLPPHPGALPRRADLRGREGPARRRRSRANPRAAAAAPSSPGSPARPTVTVDGRFGDFDDATGQITAPAGAEQPSTTTTAVDPLGWASTAQ